MQRRAVANPADIGRPVPERPPAQYLLVGAVLDTAYQPVADVRIEVLDGQRAGAFAVTNAVGRYELPGSFAGAMLVRAAKDGYVSTAKRHDPSTWSQERQQLGFTLEVSSPSVNLTGRYTLTLTADAACTRLPAEVRTRRYPTSIALRQRAPEPHQYEGELSGATFLASPLVGRFQISVAGTFGYFYLGDPYDWGDAIVEELAPSTYLAIWDSGSLHRRVADRGGAGLRRIRILRQLHEPGRERNVSVSGRGPQLRAAASGVGQAVMELLSRARHELVDQILTSSNPLIGWLTLLDTLWYVSDARIRGGSRRRWLSTPS